MLQAGSIPLIERLTERSNSFSSFDLVWFGFVVLFVCVLVFFNSNCFLLMFLKLFII